MEAVRQRPKIRIRTPITQEMSVMEIVKTNTPSGWKEVFDSSYDELEQISEIITEIERSEGPYVPLKRDLFKAFELTPLNKVKIVVVGQDPYHTILNSGFPVAQGLSFSVPPEAPLPSSLQNIFKELKLEYPDFCQPRNGDLTSWAEQGVFLLNASLTTQPGKPGAHGIVWMPFIMNVIKAISEKRPNTVFLLWGKQAQKIQQFISNKPVILESVHPSGLSANRGFFGNNHFQLANKALVEKGESPINWASICE